MVVTTDVTNLSHSADLLAQSYEAQNGHTVLCTSRTDMNFSFFSFLLHPYVDRNAV